MPTIDIRLENFEYGTKLVAHFTVDDIVFCQRFVLLPSVQDVEFEDETLTFTSVDQLLNMEDYEGTIGPDKIHLVFDNGPQINGSLTNPIGREIHVEVQRDELYSPPRRRHAPHYMSHNPLFTGGPMTFSPLTHVYVDYMVGPRFLFWRFPMTRNAVSGSVARTKSLTRFIATFDIDGVNYEFTADMVPSIQEFESSNAVLSYGYESQLSTTWDFQGTIGPDAISICLTSGITISGTLDTSIDPASTICGTGHWTQN